jgi:hypothetical protein
MDLRDLRCVAGCDRTVRTDEISRSFKMTVRRNKKENNFFVSLRRLINNILADDLKIILYRCRYFGYRMIKVRAVGYPFNPFARATEADSDILNIILFSYEKIFCLNRRINSGTENPVDHEYGLQIQQSIELLRLSNCDHGTVTNLSEL